MNFPRILRELLIGFLGVLWELYGSFGSIFKEISEIFTRTLCESFRFFREFFRNFLKVLWELFGRFSRGFWHFFGISLRVFQQSFLVVEQNKMDVKIRVKCCVYVSLEVWSYNHVCWDKTYSWRGLEVQRSIWDVIKHRSIALSGPRKEFLSFYIKSKICSSIEDFGRL